MNLITGAASFWYIYASQVRKSRTELTRIKFKFLVRKGIVLQEAFAIFAFSLLLLIGTGKVYRGHRGKTE
jgi:hypothetical protein